MSEYGVEGPPEQETDMIKDKPHVIDKWAQEVTHRPKCKVGGPTGRPADQAGRPTYWLADQAHGPHRLSFDMLRLPVGCLSWFQVLQPVAPSYKYKGRGVEEWTHIHHTLSTHLSPLELEAFILDAYVD